MKWGQYYIDTSRARTCNLPVKNVVNYKAIKFGKKNTHQGEYAVVWDDERKIIQIHFQETNGREDWIDNLTFPKKQYDTFEWNGKKITLYVHRGWGDMYLAIKHDIHVDFEACREAHKDEVKGYECVGWSLGSGQAMLAAQDLNWRYGIKPDVITFGSVKPFYYTSKTTKEYLDSCYNRAMNFCHRSDVITYQPPFVGYNMFNRVDIGPFGFFKLFDPYNYHTHYYLDELYEGIPEWS